MNMKELLAKAVESDGSNPATGKSADILPQLHPYQPGPRWTDEEEWTAIQRNLQQMSPTSEMNMKKLLDKAIAKERE